MWPEVRLTRPVEIRNAGEDRFDVQCLAFKKMVVIRAPNLSLLKEFSQAMAKLYWTKSTRQYVAFQQDDIGIEPKEAMEICLCTAEAVRLGKCGVIMEWYPTDLGEDPVELLAATGYPTFKKVGGLYARE